MHGSILREIFATHGLGDEQSQTAHLQSLKPYARAIWQAYQNQAIAVDYSDPKAQEAYLLRYFSPYSYLISFVLEDLEKSGIKLPGSNDLLSVSLFGCGPGPEIAGLIRHLKERPGQAQMLHVRMLDVASDSWRHAREIAYKASIPSEWDPALIQIEPTPFDLTSDTPFLDHDADLLVFQNCLNELSGARLSTVERKLQDALHGAPRSRIFLLIERVGYSATDELLRRVYQWAEAAGGFHTEGSLDGNLYLNCKKLLDLIPEQILQNLFIRRREMSPIQPHESGLILSSSVDYRWLAIIKK